MKFLLSLFFLQFIVSCSNSYNGTKEMKMEYDTLRSQNSVSYIGNYFGKKIDTVKLQYEADSIILYSSHLNLIFSWRNEGIIQMLEIKDVNNDSIRDIEISLVENRLYKILLLNNGQTFEPYSLSPIYSNFNYSPILGMYISESLNLGTKTISFYKLTKGELVLCKQFNMEVGNDLFEGNELLEDSSLNISAGTLRKSEVIE